jgi:hypothetical protein
MSTPEEIIKIAERVTGQRRESGSKWLLENALESIYMSGFSDESAGNVESPTGHFYRVGKWVMVTDSQGFKSLHSHETESDAMAHYNELDREFSAWDQEDEDGPDC